MRSRVAHLSGAALLVLASGCGSKPLQRLDGSGVGVVSFDASGDGGVSDVRPATDAGGAIDPPWRVPWGGRRSFVVTSVAQTDAGAASNISHTFTMMLDTDDRIAIIGKDGDTEVSPVAQDAAGVLHLMFALQFGVFVPSACGASLRYSALSFTIDPSGASLSGSGQGTLTIADPVLESSTAATMVLTGVRDTEPPILTLSAAGDIADPWTAFWVLSSEPLPGQQVRPLLQSASGDLWGLGAPTGMEAFVRVMAKPSRLLRYNDDYRVTLDGVTDLDGNPPTPTTALSFRTRAPPPLVAEDGFESVTDATLGGAQVLSGAGAPTIEGARSLYIPPATSIAGRVTQFALRLPIVSGNTVLRFAYRTVNPGDAYGVYFVVASVGGTIGTATLPPDGAGVVTTPAMIGGTQVLLGPTMTATIGLPGDAHGEIVLARLAAQPSSCGGPAPAPVPGLIIDDLYAD